MPATCDVEYTDAHGQQRRITVYDARSAFDAASQAIDAWKRQRLFLYGGHLVVKHPEKGAIRVPYAQLLEWRTQSVTAWFEAELRKLYGPAPR